MVMVVSFVVVVVEKWCDGVVVLLLREDVLADAAHGCAP